MSNGPVDAKAVTAALAAEGLRFSADEEQFFWALSFEVLARKQPPVLMLPPGLEYFLAIASIDSPKLQGPLDSLPAEILRTIIKLQNGVLLAKFNVFRDGDTIMYVALSPCSIVKSNGAELRKRLQACAELAAQIRLSLQDSPD